MLSLRAAAFLTLVFVSAGTPPALAERTEACEQLFADSPQLGNGPFTSKILSSKPGPSATVEGHVVFFEAKEKGFFKVIDGYEEKHHRLYGYQSPYHEAAAFVVSELFGFGVVPPTFMRTLTLPGQLSPKLGSVQRYIEGQTPKQLATRKGIYIEPSKLMRIFDLLIGNVDRSEGNYVITKDNQQWAIDNAAAFQTSNSLKANLDDTAKGPELRDRISSMLSEHPLVLLRLKTTSDAQIKSALGMLLMPAQIKYLIARKNTLVSVAKQQRQSF